MLAATPLAGAIAICAAITYGVRLRVAVVSPESVQDSTRCVLLSPPGASDIRTWERNLYDWAALRDPTLLVLPNERFGFSRERFAKVEIPSAPVPAYHFSMEPLGQGSPEPVSLCGQVAPLAARIANSGERILPPPVEPVLVEPLPQLTFWRFPDGRPLSGLPGFDDDRVREATGTAPPPRAPTTLRVVRSERAATSRVVVVSSCGCPALDALAVAALRRAVGEQEMQERLSPRSASPSEFMPVPGSELELQVEWATAMAAAVVPAAR